MRATTSQTAYAAARILPQVLILEFSKLGWRMPAEVTFAIGLDPADGSSSWTTHNCWNDWECEVLADGYTIQFVRKKRKETPVITPLRARELADAAVVPNEKDVAEYVSGWHQAIEKEAKRGYRSVSEMQLVNPKSFNEKNGPCQNAIREAAIEKLHKEGFSIIRHAMPEPFITFLLEVSW